MSDPARDRLTAALTRAAALRAQGDLAAAAAELAAAAADPDIAALSPRTALGLPRKLHAAMLKTAKSAGDPVARGGLQLLLGPPPGALAHLAVQDRAARAAADRLPVPPLLHQVWIGPLPPPPACAAWAAHAAARGLAYRLWREPDLATLGIPDRAVFRSRLARGDYPGAVDAARYAILAAQGGLYLDADWVPTRDDLSFADLMPLAGLCALAEPVPRLTHTGSLLLANSFLAAPPAHPVFATLDRILPQVEAVLPGAPAWWTTGPVIFTLLARGGAVTLAPHDLVAGELPPGARLQDAAALAPRGLIAAWKPWPSRP
jgi:hypothetical protein